MKYFLASLIMLSACASKTTPQKNAVMFDTQGHRGCRGLMPENTIPAMIKALDVGVTTLEMDVVITADSQVILSHEPFFNSQITTKPDGQPLTKEEASALNIFKMPYRETQRYDVGQRGHPGFPQQQKMAVTKPLLADVFDAVEKHIQQKKLPRVFYNIETKSKPSTDNIYHPGPETFVRLLMKVIAEKKLENVVVIQSFDPRTLRVLHREYPVVKTSLLIENFDKRPIAEQIKDLGFQPDFYSPAHELVTPELVSFCKEKKIRLVPWTVNDLPRMQALKNMGVDGIISDYPNLFAGLQ